MRTLGLRAAQGVVSLEVRDTRVVAVTLDGEPHVAMPDTLSRLVGGHVVRAFSDAHIHLLGFARALTTPDLGPSACPTIPALLEKLSAVRATRSNGWAVLRGFDDALILERRLPTRSELDRATGNVPLRLRHRTGHASILNSAAFERMPSPPRRATIEVDRESVPVMLVGAEDWLNGLTGRPPAEDLVAGLRQAEAFLRRQGIVRVWDATPKTAVGIREMNELLASVPFDIDVDVMAAIDCLSDPGELPARVIKLFPDDLGRDLGAAIALAHARGARVAVHCTELSELEATLSALEQAGSSAHGDRIEHATLCTEAQAERMARLGLIAVVHPGWLTERGRKYEEQIAPSELQWLLPLRTISNAGCQLAFGSDAPMALPVPRMWIDVVTRRRGSQRLSKGLALEAASGVALWPQETPGSSFIVLGGDQESSDPDVLATCRRGQLAPVISSPN